MAVMLTEKAASAFRRYCDDMKAEAGTMLRVGVMGGGCSGFQYQLTPDTALDEKADATFEFHGVKVIVDKKSALYLDGTTIDFHDGLDRQGFTFNNPNVVKSCGCGSSFGV